MADAFSELSRPPAADPDAQATITDFLDYTEFFPSDLFRSLTLIGKLDDSYSAEVDKVHELTKTYGSLPGIPPNERPEPQQLREDISVALGNALRSRESTYAEASRLYDAATNLHARIQSIKSKLQAMPKPPSRDPTPAPSIRSPNVGRPRKIEIDRTPRIKLVTETGRGGGSARPDASAAAAVRPRHRSRRIVVPGEVLPPLDPNSPGISIGSDSDSDGPPSPPVRLDKLHRERTPKLHRLDKIKLPKIPKIRAPGAMGTNVHSSVAGISVSNAMAQLAPPPPDPILGSKHAPWLKLTEWELNKLRKKMKKNADWMPSDIMVKRELVANGRGMENYLKTKAYASQTGVEFVDEEPEEFVRPTTFRTKIPHSMTALGEDEQLVNRGMKLNEAKKLKREMMLKKEQAEREEANNRIIEAGLAISNLFSQGSDGVMGGFGSPESNKSTSGNKKKRKRLSSPSAAGASNDGAAATGDTTVGSNGVKRIKLARPGREAPPGSSKGTTNSTRGDKFRFELSKTGSGRFQPSRHKSTTRSGRSSVSTPLHGASSDQAPTSAPSETAAAELSDRPRSRGSTSIKLKLSAQKAASAEPPGRRESLRRVSNSSVPGAKSGSSSKPATSKQSSALREQAVILRKGKRPAPGFLTSNSDEAGAKVSLGKRKAAPTNKRTSGGSKPVKGGDTGPAANPGAAQEQGDTSEETYCICGDVSYGFMIACEDPNCEIEWFHIGCVGLSEVKGQRLSRLHWYCPNCRDKHDVGEDGIVRK